MDEKKRYSVSVSRQIHKSIFSSRRTTRRIKRTCRPVKRIQTKPTIMLQAERIERLEKRLRCADIVIAIMRDADTVMRKETGRFFVKGLE